MRWKGELVVAARRGLPQADLVGRGGNLRHEGLVGVKVKEEED